MGFLDFVGAPFQSAPSLNVVPLDPGTQQIIQGQYKDATSSNASLAGKANQGITSNTFGMKDPATQAASTGDSASMFKAIQNKYGQEASKGINQVVRNNNMNVPFMRDPLLNTASHGQLAMHNIEAQNSAALVQAQFQAEMARAEVLRGIFSGAGTAIGYSIAQNSGRRSAKGRNPSFGGDPLDGSGGPNFMGQGDF